MKLFRIAKNNYLLFVGLAILTLFLQPINLLTTALALLILFSFFSDDKKAMIIIFVIVSSLALTRTINPILRLVIQLLDYLLLLFLFFKEFEFQFHSYPRIPKELLHYLGWLFSIMVISTIHSSYFYVGLEQIVRTLLFFFLVYLLYSFIKDEKTVRIYLMGLFIVAVIYLSFLIYEFIQFNYDFLAFNINSSGPNGNSYLHKNALGSFFVLSLLLLISYAFNPRRSQYRKWISVLVVVFTSGLLVTNARAALLAFIGGVIFLIYKIQKKYLKYFLSSLGFVVSLYFILPIQNYIDLYFRFEKISTGRDFILSSIWTVIKGNWLFGTGPAGSRFEMYKGMPYMLGSPEELYLRHHYEIIEFGHAHNFYLFFLSDLGILGFILSLMLPFLFLKISFETIAILELEKKDNYYLALGITAFGIAIFIRGFFEWAGILSYGTIGYDLPFWILFSIQLFLHQTNKINVVKA